MKHEYKDIELFNNSAKRIFEMKLGDHTAFIRYTNNKDKLFLIHTEVPESLEGKGAGTAIIEKTLTYIEEKKMRAVPLCPFIIAYIERHPEWNRVVEK